MEFSCFFGQWILLKYQPNYDNVIVVLCGIFQKDLPSEVDVMDKDF